MSREDDLRELLRGRSRRGAQGGTAPGEPQAPGARAPCGADTARGRLATFDDRGSRGGPDAPQARGTTPRASIFTGARTAFKFYLSSFGPKGALNAHLNALNEGEITPDPDRMISLCDEVIARAPRDEVAWANKGAALFMKQELTSAIEAFDRALATDPDHLNSLFYKATSYALLCQHSVAIRHVARAASAHPEGLRKLLLSWHEAKKALAASALAVLRDEPDRRDVRQLFVEHFL
jgi:tetratricopeptide (TPR) repeat protein